MVVAPKAYRIQRVARRDGISEQQIKNRLRNQLEDREKIPLAHYVIDNTELLETQKKVKKVHTTLLGFSQ